jgi:EAL domain-containing protein (putative c-di-GMP-specific phosphodiesterase class I)
MFASDAVDGRESIDFSGCRASARRDLPVSSNRSWLVEHPQLAVARERIADVLERRGQVAVLSLELTPYGESAEAAAAAGMADLFDGLAELVAAKARASHGVAIHLSHEHHVLVLAGTTAPAAEQFVASVAREWGLGVQFGRGRAILEINAGISASPDDGTEARDLLRRAGSALREARRLRATAVCYRAGLEEAQSRRLRIAADIDHAAVRGEWSLVYQPLLSIRSGKIDSFEALLRWRHPVLGDVEPSEFIPVAEESGRINALTRWVLGTAVAQLADWRSLGVSAGLAINLSPQDLLDPRLWLSVNEPLTRHGIDGRRLTFEITEHAVLADLDSMATAMARITRCGPRFALDDFGTGHSSLAVLKALPVSELKIDRAFSGDLHPGSRDELIVGSAVALARSLEMRTVAEGIESQAALDAVARLGCDAAQGYLIGRALAPEQVQIAP